MSIDVATVAAIDRPVRLRMRPDLAIGEQWFSKRRYFVVKDPLSLSYSYLTEQEHFILAQLDGLSSIAEIQQRFAGRFAPQQVTATQLHGFLAQLHRSGLVLGDDPGQGERLIERRAARQQFDPLRWAERLLAIRWRGVNPEPFLAWLEPKLGWLFSPWGVVLWIAIVTWAAAVAFLHLDEFSRRLPSAGAWLIGSNLLWLGIATIIIKTLHELGHALAARRVGCQCREMGVQLFFLLPCLYTNVSDVWLVPSKWRRIMVSAAGIYVELLLAAAATLVWWQAEPGVLASLCQSVMVVASVGTLALNGNPLMRYDGYYILADLVEVPNLEQRSRSQLVGWLARWCAGVEWQPRDELDRRPRPLLAAYAAAAIAYRSAVLVGVYLASRAMLRPLALEPVADVLVAGAALGIIIPLAMTLGQFIVDARQRKELRPLRLAVSAASLSALIAAGCLVPLPQRITAPVVIEPRDSTRVYATIAGTLEEAVAAGSIVKAGQSIARLENPALQRDLARLLAEQKQQELHLVELETIRGDDPARAAAIPAARQSLADLETRIAQLRELIGRLTLAAPHDGIVLPPPKRQDRKSPRTLAGWTGTPLDSENRGAFVETGTLIGLVARPGSIEALAVVEQADAPLVLVGRKVSTVSAQWPRGVVRGIVEDLARVDAQELPLHLAATGAIPQQADASGANRSLHTTYQVRIRLDEPPQNLLPGATGRALIVAPPQPLATRLLRWLSRTFRFSTTG